MSRARGKHTERHLPPQITNDEDPEVRDVGGSTRTQGVPSAIPGGRPHLTNAPAVRHPVPTPDSKPEIRGVNAHGVLPDSHTTRERAEFMRGPNDLQPLVPHYQHHQVPEPPVAVRVVQEAPATLRTAAPHHVTLQASTGDPVRLCGVDRNRVMVLLLNESQSSDARFAHLYGDLTNGGGALLPWPMNSYLKLPTQDELWAISADTGTPTVSVIQVYDRPA